MSCRVSRTETVITNVVSTSARIPQSSQKTFILCCFFIFIFTVLHLHWKTLQRVEAKKSERGIKQTLIATSLPFQHFSLSSLTLNKFRLSSCHFNSFVQFMSTSRLPLLESLGHSHQDHKYLLCRCSECLLSPPCNRQGNTQSSPSTERWMCYVQGWVEARCCHVSPVGIKRLLWP